MSPGELHVNKLAGFTPDLLLYVCNNVSADEMKNAVDNGLLVSVDSRFPSLTCTARSSPAARS